MNTLFRLFLFLSIFLLFAGPIRAQINRLNGLVLDATTEEPLPYATVFFNTTTNGTTTDQDGNFSIPFNPNFRELVVTYVGYQPITYQVKESQLNVQFKFKLVPSPQEIEEIEVTAERSQAWYDNLAVFEREFIGRSTFAERTKITNPEVLFFDFDPKAVRLKAKARQPLKIINQALGYEIEYTLAQFDYDIKNKRLTVLGYPRFTELQGKKGKRKRWKRNRAKAYNGSLTHFLKTLRDQRIDKEGFDIRKFYRRPKNKSLLAQNATGNVAQSKTEVPKNATPVRSSGSAYIDYLEKKAYDYRKDLSFSGDQAKLGFEEYWQITYEREREDLNYSNGQWFSNTPRTNQISMITMTADQVGINALGIPDDPLAILVEGYWAFEKMGELLPLDYEPND